jgi:hypothetical protein
MNFRHVAKVLAKTADIMETTPSLDTDSALRQAVWGTPRANAPRGQTNDTDLYDEAATAISCYGVNPADTSSEPYAYVGDVPRRDAIKAARAEAKRFGKYR